MNLLEGKVAVVTGASSGIGAATVKELAKHGAIVVMAARRTERLKELAESIETETLAITTDVSKRSDVENLFEQVKEKFGRVDILINNAGILLPSLLENLNVDDWDKMIDINLKGSLYCFASVLPMMKEQNSGHIINLGSRGAHRIRKRRAVYSATKYAIRALTEGMRQEITPQTGIRVSLISPGAVDTEINRYLSGDEMNEFGKNLTFETLNSENVANAILYALTQPANVNINEILVLPTGQEV